MDGYRIMINTGVKKKKKFKQPIPDSKENMNRIITADKHQKTEQNTLINNDKTNISIHPLYLALTSVAVSNKEINQFCATSLKPGH